MYGARNSQNNLIKRFIERFVVSPHHPATPCWHPGTLIATGLGIGYLRPAPGTWGSFLGILFAPVVMAYGGTYGMNMYLLLTFLLGLWASEWYQRQTETKDASEVVIDEIVGVGITCQLVGATDLAHLITAFLLFRLFDITKPFPVGWADRNLKGGFGIMMDDVLAGLAAGGSYLLLSSVYSHVFAGG